MEFVNVEIDDRVATVTFDRPPVNALNAQAFREIEQAFTELRHGTDAHVAIFTAAGERVFCGGVDLNDSARRHGREQADGDSIVDLLDPGSIVRDCFWALSDCPLPVIGAINGAAVGAGLALGGVLRRDHRVGARAVRAAGDQRRRARRRPSPATHGRSLQDPQDVLHRRVRRGRGVLPPRRGGEGRARPASCMAEARALADVIATKSPIGLRLAKESLNRVEDLGLKDGYRLEQDYTGRITRYHDSAEARRSYLEKRDPEWTWT